MEILCCRGLFCGAGARGSPLDCIKFPLELQRKELSFVKAKEMVMHMKYKTLLALLSVIALCIIIGSGFCTRNDVMLTDYQAADDILTMKVDVSDSMGYVRACSEKQDGDRLYVRFWSAFGGYSGSLGASDSFSIKVPDACREIYFCRSGNESDLVLSRDDAASGWKREPFGEDASMQVQANVQK